MPCAVIVAPETGAAPPVPFDEPPSGGCTAPPSTADAASAPPESGEPLDPLLDVEPPELDAVPLLLVVPPLLEAPLGLLSALGSDAEQAATRPMTSAMRLIRRW